MGSTIAIIGFAIWPDLTRTQSLNHAIKTCPTVLDYERVGTNLGGSAEYKLQKAEDFPPVSDEATSQVVFITHEPTKTGMDLKYCPIPPLPPPQSTQNLPP